MLWNALEHSAKAIDSGPPAPSREELVARRRKSNAMWALASEPALACLRQLFAALLISGRASKDKELRNEVLIVANLIARHRKSHAPFRTTHLLQLLLLYATAAEKGATVQSLAYGGDDETGQTGHGSGMAAGASRTLAVLGQPLADPHNYATISGPDLELKRILWALLSDLSRMDSANLDLIVRSDLVECLLMYLDIDLAGGGAAGDASGGGGGAGSPALDDELTQFDDGDMGLSLGSHAGGAPGGASSGDRRVPEVIARLPRTQLRVLQQQAMAVLLNLAPRAPERFQSLRGHIITLAFLDRCGGQKDSASLVQARETAPLAYPSSLALSLSLARSPSARGHAKTPSR